MDELRLDAQSLALPLEYAPHLREKYQSLTESLADKDAAAIYDHSKTLLESVCRTIIINRNGQINETPDRHATFVDLYRQTCASLVVHESDEIFLPIIKKSVAVIASMRDTYGASSHGQDGYVQRTVRIEEALFTARLSLATAGYLYSRHLNTSVDHKNQRMHYEDNPNFNESLDIDGDIEVAGILVAPPSRILFDHDLIAYRERLIEFTNEIYLAEIEAAADVWAEMQNDRERGH